MIASPLLLRSMPAPENLSPRSPPAVECCPGNQLVMRVSWPSWTKIHFAVKCKEKQLLIRVLAESTMKTPLLYISNQRMSHEVICS
ncbi:hypothetical protein D5086_002652 [Populus alba]|uniref:Uncharacterized protein n=1 Tax=Populus alba TaxID=43335 RepID=A0ACC4D2C8_POPAL